MMKNQSLNRIFSAQTGKYLVSLLICFYIILIFIFTSGSTKGFKVVSKAVSDAVKSEKLIQQNVQKVKKIFELNGSEYDGVLYYKNESSMSAEEILLIKVKKADQVQVVRDAIEKHIEERKNVFESYAPAQYKLLNDAEIYVRGDYIFVAVSLDEETYSQAFLNSL